MSIVTVHVKCSSTNVGSERRFDKGTTIANLKGKLEMITGASAGSMELRLDDNNGSEICKMADDSKMLGAYPVEDYCTVYVIDHDEANTQRQFEDLSLVEKYEMKDEDYDAKTDTVRAYKKKNQMGRFNSEFQKEAAAHAEAKDREGEEEAKAINVGQRCQVNYNGIKRGQVMYVGKTDFASGWWVGVKYDEPLGKNDGTVKGKFYFDCQMKYGGFVRPATVEVGDFPEEDFNLSDLSSDGEM